MKKIIAILALAATTATTASAQMRFGPEVGLNMSSITTKIGSNTNTSDLKLGARVGFVADIPLTYSLYLRPGVQFAMMGGKTTNEFFGTSVTATETLNYIQIPVSILYKFGQEGGGRFYLALTPYVGFGIGGSASLDGKKVEEYKPFSDEMYKSLDLGVGLKVGYELPMGLYVDAGYLQGLTNNLNEPTIKVGDYKATNGNFTIGVGYLFGGSRY